MKCVPTGRTRHRAFSPCFSSKVLMVLQIEVTTSGVLHSSGGIIDELPSCTKWVDASPEDLTEGVVGVPSINKD